MKSMFAECELSRWMRPDAHRFVRPDWRRYVKDDADIASIFSRYERKYRSDQPRVPAGGSQGGQWTADGDSSNSPPSEPPEHSNHPSSGEVDVAARVPPSREAECEMQYRKDTFICNLVRTQTCWAQAMFRRAQCIRGGYIPPLYH